MSVWMILIASSTEVDGSCAILPVASPSACPYTGKPGSDGIGDANEA